MNLLVMDIVQNYSWIALINTDFSWTVRLTGTFSKKIVLWRRVFGKLKHLLLSERFYLFYLKIL